jgi:hypothetical protein
MRKVKRGRVTASIFSQIITSKGEVTSGATRDALRERLATERATGVYAPRFKSQWMQRGIDLEPVAISAYEEQTGNKVIRARMVFLDESEAVACIPDGVVMSGRGA